MRCIEKCRYDLEYPDKNSMGNYHFCTKAFDKLVDATNKETAPQSVSVYV